MAAADKQIHIPFKKLPEQGDPDFALFQAGVEEGKRLTRMEVLGFLEKEYIDDTIERGSAKGEAILGLVKELVALLNNQNK